MPEESTGDIEPSILTNQKKSDMPDWTQQELKEKGDRIFKEASKIGEGGRVIEPELTKTDVLSSMEQARTEAAKKGEADTAGAIGRNIKRIRGELRGGS